MFFFIFQGVWKPRRIQNPFFFEDLEPYKMTPIVNRFIVCNNIDFLLEFLVYTLIVVSP